MSQAFLPLEPYTVMLQCHSLQIPSSTVPPGERPEERGLRFEARGQWAIGKNRAKGGTGEKRATRGQGIGGKGVRDNGVEE